MNTKALFGLIAIAFLFFITGCSTGPIEDLSFSSPEGGVVVEVSGSVPAPLDPIRVTMLVKIPEKSKERDLSFDFHGGSMTMENVKAEWETNYKGKIIFTQQDDSQVLVNIRVNDLGLQITQDFIDPNGEIFLP